MPVKTWPLSRRTSAMALFLLATSAAIVGVYFTFDFYLTSVSRELVGSWLQSEAVAIEEGQLLSSITKNQRVLLSSQFVKGVTLFDFSSTPPSRLIEVGEHIDAENHPITKDGDPDVTGAGVFHKHVRYRIPNRPDLVLTFDVQSKFLLNFFYASVAVMLLFIIVLFGSIAAVEKREFKKREAFLKQALNDFIGQDRPSEFVESELPFLVRWWKDRKTESEKAKLLAIENESKILLGELAARVAHDIRSPLNTINAVTSKLTNLPEGSEGLLKGAIQRIRDIANGIGDRNRLILAKEGVCQSPPMNAQGSIEPVLIFTILEETTSEKRLQYEELQVEITLEISPESYRTFAKINILELKRNLSNLIDNAVQAIVGSGSVLLMLGQVDGRLQISISDTGSGIPSSLLSRVGEKGFTSGKQKGSGLGVFYAKAAAMSWGGQLNIVSTEGKGTTVTISLPIAAAPAWFVGQVSLSKGATVVILDDDPTIHAMWQDLMKDKSSELRVEHFFDPVAATSWFVQNRTKIGNYFLLSDYDLQSKDGTGLDVIECLDLHDKNVMLVTGAYDDQRVRSRCEQMKIKILPKPALTWTPVVVG